MFFTCYFCYSPASFHQFEIIPKWPKKVREEIFVDMMHNLLTLITQSCQKLGRKLQKRLRRINPRKDRPHPIDEVWFDVHNFAWSGEPIHWMECICIWLFFFLCDSSADELCWQGKIRETRKTGWRSEHFISSRKAELEAMGDIYWCTTYNSQSMFMSTKQPVEPTIC